MYYVYVHYRPDTGAPFYVGRGMVYKRSRFLRRAAATARRNKLWNRIVAKNDGEFLAKIVFSSVERDAVLDKERELIQLYGKIIDRAGTLCNITDGGDGSLGLSHTPEARRKMAEAHARDRTRAERFKSEAFVAHRIALTKGLPSSMRGRKHSAEAIAKMTAKRTGALSYLAKRVVDIRTGVIYGCVEEAAKACGYTRSSLHTYLKPSARRPNPTSMRYVDGL